MPKYAASYAKVLIVAAYKGKKLGATRIGEDYTNQSVQHQS